MRLPVGLCLTVGGSLLSLHSWFGWVVVRPEIAGNSEAEPCHCAAQNASWSACWAGDEARGESRVRSVSL